MKQKINFGRNLKEIREGLCLTQKRLAELSKIPASSISHFESGKRLPSFNNLVALREAMTVPTDFLIYGYGYMTRVDKEVVDLRVLADDIALAISKYEATK